MAFPTEVEFVSENIVDSAFSATEDAIWNFRIGEPLNCSGKGIQRFLQIRKESSSSTTTLASGIIDDLVTRKKVWERIFGTTPMPLPEKNSLKKSYGLLNSCFTGTNFKGQEVLDMLKKSK
jgi:hypothetical protein